MTQPTQLDRVCAAVRAAAEEGCPVAGNAEAKARIAIRRWGSYKNRGVNEDDLNARTRDLAKGLAHHFEQDPSLVGPLIIDYEYLASRIAEVLAAQS